MVVALVGAALAACHAASTSQAEAQEVARELCRCSQPGDASCIARVAGTLGMVSDACLQCVLADEHACAVMLDQCPQLCSLHP